ncbi:alanine transaminase [Malassezia caprae]|uniref:Glutamate pyruvate transaminase n=1 Tax=Malassezia caprae TaxID=1381934 RepID=A0AAF0IXJ8_9BASI|nr:alanine transaminase [Malassezia caprae]
MRIPMRQVGVPFRRYVQTFRTKKQTVMRLDTINPQAVKAEYAVRGEIPQRAHQIERELEHGAKLPYDSVLWTNIGNPQQQPILAQEPLTFWRQVAALTEYPALLHMEPSARDAMFPTDVQERAKELLDSFGSLGAYTNSRGNELVRQHVVDFLCERDGYVEDFDNVYLTAGASAGVQLLFQVFFTPGKDAVLIPTPQYPLYSAASALYDVEPVYYQLQSNHNWDLSFDNVREQISVARASGVSPRAIVVINPGNPTGSCLSKEEIEQVIELAYKEGLVIFADEVYQANVYQNERPFISFRKVLLDLGKSSDPRKREMSEIVELVSLHSISKGMTGECGRRGGFFVLNNFDKEVDAQVLKLASLSLCPPAQGQVGVDLLVRPPREGEPSYDLWKQETLSIFETLKGRSELIAKRLGELPGMKVEPAMGAMYVFPRLHLSKSASDAAKKAGKRVDEFYCLQLLEETGICVIPGSGFSFYPEYLEDGSSYSFFRTTVLAKATEEMVERFVKFHLHFRERFP